MAEKILTDTGLLLEWGKTQAEFEAELGWNPSIMDVVDTGQGFEDRQIYFYFPTLNQFFKSTPKLHAVFRAAKTIFTESRWDEISDILDQYSLRDQLNTFDMTTARRKVQRARQIGLITAAEAQSLADLVAHLPG